MIKMICGLLTALLVATGGNAGAQQVNWKMATAVAGGPVMDWGAKAFADRMLTLSGGRFKITVFPGGALGNALKVSETVHNGVAEAGHTWMAYDWGADTTTVLFAGYAGSFDTERMLHWLYEGGGAQLQRSYREASRDVISFPLYVRPAEVFLHSRKPVRTLEDLRGLKLRTSGAWLEMAKELGAAPVTLAAGEIFPALERGVIDALEWSTLSENVPSGFHKVAKYIVVPGIHQPTSPWELVINKKAWNALSPSDKALVETVAKMVTLESYLRIGQEDAKSLAVYEKAGNEVIELSRDVQLAARRIASAWSDRQARENPRFAEILKHQRAFEALWKDADKYRSVVANPAVSK